MNWLRYFLKPAESLDRKRLWQIALFVSALYAVTISYLILYWYHLETRMPFHWFDDSLGWLQMDKGGHIYGAFTECSLGIRALLWAGVSRKRSCFWAAFISFSTQTSYEIFDGFCDGYGASVTDIIANAIGVLLPAIQYWCWGKLKLFNKISFYPSALIPLRPQFFGDSLPQQFLKDYNGLTFWFSVDLNTMTGKKILPKWLLLTFGYSADGLLGGDDNIWTDKDGTLHDYSHIARARKFVFSIDFNWGLLQQPGWKTIGAIFTHIKFPTPALEWHTSKGFRWHWWYF